MVKDTVLVWFRNDLRVHDNEILLSALERADQILPVFVFDTTHFGINDISGLRKTGVLRAKFLIESITDLKKSLQERGGDLLVRVGLPEEIIPELAGQCKVKEVYHHREVAQEETQVSARVEAALWKQKLNLRHFIGHTLYHKEDLPFPIKDIPDEFSVFRKKVERESSIRNSSSTPTEIAIPEGIDDYGEIPNLQDLGYDESEIRLSAITDIHGGESQAGQFIRELLTPENDLVKHSSLSPWIQLGCVSVHRVHGFLQENKAQLTTKIYDAMHLGLLWRDYYRFMFKKHGNTFFKANGFSKEDQERSVDYLGDAFKAWCQAKTGHGLVDEIMETLNLTGRINHEGRLVVAHYLIDVLQVSHILGASYFESTLLDYCPASNYGNWSHVARVGTSKRDNAARKMEKLCNDYLTRRPKAAKLFS